MEKMKISELADLCGGTLVAGDPALEIPGLSTDSRVIEEGYIFLALKGENFNGHTFAESALARGASGIIGQSDEVQRLKEGGNRRKGLIAVDETLAALHRLALAYRSKFDMPLVAITGSCGKTTTKDMLASILKENLKTVKTEGNLNNLIGAPLMLLRLDSETEAAVIEIASNAPGEIECLSRILSPTAAIITNIGPVHLEGFGTIEGVFKEKSAVLEHIRSGGFAVINNEDIGPEYISSIFEGKTITFGQDESADYFASEIRQDMKAGTEFLLNGEDSVRIPILGTHNVHNALAAIAAAKEFGIDIDTIREGLRDFPATAMRMETHAYKGATVINDAYNANPRAMRASISTIMAMPAERKILALGDMLELGAQSAVEHRSLGHYAGLSDPDQLYLVGEFKEECREGALKAGMQPERIHCCADVEEVGISLKYTLRPGDLVLLKGSRGIRMEDALQQLKE